MSDASRASGWPPQRVALATLVVVAVLGVFLLLYFFSDVFLLLLIGIVLAIALSPAVAVLQRLGVSRATASVVVYLSLGVLLVAGAWFALPSVYSQSQALIERLPHSYQQLRSYLTVFVDKFACTKVAGLGTGFWVSEEGKDAPRSTV